MATKDELERIYNSYDIDYYLLINGRRIAHFASAGGIIPKMILDNYAEILAFDEYIKKMAIWTEAIPSQHLDEIVSFSSKKEKENYLKTFLSFSHRGLLSYDRTALGNVSDNKYHLVSVPNTHVELKSLPIQFQNLLLKLTIQESSDVPQSLILNEI